MVSLVANLVVLGLSRPPATNFEFGTSSLLTKPPQFMSALVGVWIRSAGKVPVVISVVCGAAWTAGAESACCAAAATVRHSNSNSPVFFMLPPKSRPGPAGFLPLDPASIRAFKSHSNKGIGGGQGYAGVIAGTLK